MENWTLVFENFFRYLKNFLFFLFFYLIVPFGMIAHAANNIPLYYWDYDGDGVYDDDDIDDDGDGILDIVEDLNHDGDNNPTTNPTDTDGDGVPDYLDLDSDNDGVLDNLEGPNFHLYRPPSGLDTDGNGLDDTYESYPGAGQGIIPFSRDSDIYPNYLD